MLSKKMQQMTIWNILSYFYQKKRVWNSCKLSPMKFQSLFSGKNTINLSSAEFAIAFVNVYDKTAISIYKQSVPVSSLYTNLILDIRTEKPEKTM